MKGCCSSTPNALEVAIDRSNLVAVNRILEKTPTLTREELAKARSVADCALKEREIGNRTFAEKLLFYVGGTLAILYTLNLIAYTFSSYLREKMFEAHGLGPTYIYPIALTLISVLAFLAYRGWQGPERRFQWAVEIKRILDTIQG